MKSAPRPMHTLRATQSGVVLLVVLAFVVLLTGVVVILMTRSMSNSLMSGSSANIGKTDLYGRGAIHQILGDLRQEIVDGSTLTTIVSGSVTNRIYTPVAHNGTFPTATPYNAGPAVYTAATWTNTLPNLVKESIRNVPFYRQSAGYASDGTSRASALSTTNASLNGHSLSAARWNKPLLLPKKNTGSTSDLTPASPFVPPDWILTRADGTNPQSLDTEALSPSGNNPVVGRYAYAIYNEGGLLDVNVAGSPSMTGVVSALTNAWNGKGSSAFADLTVLKDSSGTQVLTQKQVDSLVGWRNYASAQPSGSFPSFSFTITSATNFLSTIIGSTTRGMSPMNSSLSGGGSDQMFVSRQHLIQFFSTLGNTSALQNALQYLGTFSRSLNQPSYAPPSDRPRIVGPIASTTAYTGGNDGFGKDDTINPSFRTLRVASSFLRNDGTTAATGNPLVNKRFALSRLCWLTYKGPSADLYASRPNDPAIVALLQDGVPLDMIKAGTGGTDGNIYKYFGLIWTAGGGADGLGGSWTYNHGAAGVIQTLNQVSGRDPDFFELLKAGVVAGGIGKIYAGSNASYNLYGDLEIIALTNHIDPEIVQIAANIVSQASPADYPTAIVFNDGTRNHCIWGVCDLPYLYGLANLGVLVRQATPAPPALTLTTTAAVTQVPLTDGGQCAAIQVPIVWNPHSPKGTARAPGLSPTYLRVCVSNLTATIPSQFPTSGNLVNFYFWLFPRCYYSDNTLLASLPVMVTPWGGRGSGANASYDPTKGYLSMPLDGVPGNTALMFNNGTAADTLYRDPTVLLQPSALGPTVNLHADSNNVLTTVGGFASSEITEFGSNNSYVGFLEGSFAQRFNATGPISSSAAAAGINTANTYTIDNVVFQLDSMGTTYSLEYSLGGPNGPWIPYKQYTPSTTNNPAPVPYGYGGGGPSVWLKSALQSWILGSSASGLPPYTAYHALNYDPRSVRAGFNQSQARTAFLDPSDTLIQTARPNVAQGLASNSYNVGGVSKDQYVLRSSIAGFTDGGGYVYDADGVIRRSMGGYVPGTGNVNAATTVGLPMATTYNTSANASNRPIVLHRPFRSVTELGYVFTNTPWRNLSFSTPESPAAPLLDLFCVNDDHRTDALEAGKIDLNGRQTAVFQALLSGAYRDEFYPISTYAGAIQSPALTSANALTLAQMLVARTYNTSTAGKGPLVNVADLVGRWKSGSPTGISTQGANGYDGFSADVAATVADQTTLIQRLREAPIRALAAAGQAGTWNLLIDVVAQSGRYPDTGGIGNPANFLVEGERRYWVHVALDRQTGQIIDESIEEVTE